MSGSGIGGCGSASLRTTGRLRLRCCSSDIIVHSTIHPVMAPDKGSGFFPHAYYRQSNAFDLGASRSALARSI